jgi:hypothetical protein
MNEKDHNLMAQSHNIPIFQTAIKRADEMNYKKSHNNLLNVIQNSLDYFKNTNFEKCEVNKLIKIPKEELEKLKNENESLISENNKLSRMRGEKSDINVNKVKYI